MSDLTTSDNIIAEGVSRSFGHAVAVRDVSFSIRTGEIVGLLGHNGAGKSTIMKLLGGYLELDEGKIAIGGLNISESKIAIQQQLGYLPESLPLYPDMTVLDYLEFAAKLRRIPPKIHHEAVRQAIAATDLQNRAFSAIGTLSRGYQQRVGVAQAILHQPKILIMDEPANGLDPNQTKAMRQLILRLAEKATVILSTHIMQEVEALCDRVLIMRTGRLALDTRMDKLGESRRLYLRSAVNLQQLQGLVGDLGLVASTEEEGGFWLECKELVDAETAASVAHKLTGAGIALYELYPERRNLEQVFSSIVQGAV